MDYPPKWDVFSDTDFELAVPRDPGALGIELMAQLRVSGRVQDHWRLVLGGSSIIEFNVPLRSVFSFAPKWTMTFAVWPRDITIKRNTTTSVWQDVRDLVASNDTELLGENGDRIINTDFVDMLSEHETPAKPLSASLRWAVVIGDGERPELHLQMLPGGAGTLNGKPVLRWLKILIQTYSCAIKLSNHSSQITLLIIIQAK